MDKKPVLPRLISALLCFVLILSMTPGIHAQAPRITTFRDTISGQKTLSYGIPTLDAIVSEGAQALRQGLEERKTEIYFSYTVSPESDLPLYESIYLAALKHTGVPTQGDYLSYHIHTVNIDGTSYEYTDRIEYSLLYTVTYCATAQEEQAMAQTYENVMASLALAGKSDYQKICAIYDFITSHVTYDYAHLSDPTYLKQWSAYAALMDGTSVCQGFSNLLYRMCLDAGLDCRILTGTANGEPHSWNIVKIEGRYYFLDATWDAALAQASQPYQYFLKGYFDFQDHPISYPPAPQNGATYVYGETAYRNVFLKDQVQGPFQYDVAGGIATLTGYTGSEAHVTVPATLGGYPLEIIGSHAFYANPSIRSITFSQGNRFAQEYHIVFLPNLETVDYGKTMQMEPTTVHSGLNCAPKDCPNLREVKVHQENPYLQVKNGVLYAGDTLMFVPPAAEITQLQVDEHCTMIHGNAAAGCTKLKKVILSQGITHIGPWAFNGCSGLEEVVFNQGLTYIGTFAFQNSGLKTIHLPKSLEYFMDGALCNTPDLQTITADPDNPIFYARDNVLYTDPENPILVAYNAGSARTSFTIPQGVTQLGCYAFTAANNLETITFPASLNRINEKSIAYCTGITQLVLPKNLKTIESRAFIGSDSITAITIPQSLSQIGEMIFSESGALRYVMYTGSQAQWNALSIHSNNVALDNASLHFNAKGDGSDVPQPPQEPQQPQAPAKIETTPMYRLYNPNSGEHFYTGSIQERDNLTAAGWQYEGVAWNAPTKTGAPVYRLFNPNSGDHHYTMSLEEKDMLVGVGWIYEGVAWNSAPVEHPEALGLYRLYNPNADCGSHHYTGSMEERQMLESVGWIYEGIGWFGMLR